MKYLVGLSLAVLMVILIFSIRYWQERSSGKAISKETEENAGVPIVLKEFNDYQ
ncbi:MAG: hypothetical protein HYY20_03725 [Candidatus Tectomicrobia bacterium]|uniref:Uncharacterized protein n=1 Tax=Tectimicrobiota bacterium TaxID=2528274 RepID=A0A932FW55_UNCTE|nr:hypothetical protein [Candidatus Tectomicrobia bacterium]